MIVASPTLVFSFLFVSLFFSSMVLIPDAYGEEKASQFVSNPLKGVFDWFNDIMSANIQASNFDNETKQNWQNVLDAGTNSGKTGVELWSNVHETLSDGIVAVGSGNIDRGIAMLIAFVATTVVIGLLVYKLIRHSWKIFAIVIFVLAGIFLIFWVIGIANPTI